MGGGNIKVVVRCRPLNSKEIARGAKCLIRMDGNQTIITRPDINDPGNAKVAKRNGVEDMKSFTFDESYWSFDKNDPNYATQAMLYEDLGEELLDHTFEGYNTCIFAYGQTGAGKTYSMMGYGEDKGIIPLTCFELFKRVDNNQDPELTYQVQVSYIEIYNERVRDLLNPRNKKSLKVREHPVLGPYVEDLSKLVVSSFDDIENLLDEGNKLRTVSATNINETSSRSHAIFTLLVTQKRHDSRTNIDTEKVSRISLVDLAGSERANSAGATGTRLKEGANINKSLTTFGKVIAVLAEQSSGYRKYFVPYRDSVLTWLLKDSLGGNSKTVMIAAISPADYDETLSTLRYADAAKRIKNKAVVNEDPNVRLTRELKVELLMLRSKVGGGASYDSSAPYDSSVPPSQQLVVLQDKDGNTIKKTKEELTDQIQVTEKLMKEVNETWAEKLRKTEEIQQEREKTLKELGIMVEKNAFGIHPHKKVPHLVNLDEDPLLSECIIYQIKPGKTRVGRIGSDVPSDIRLSGENILDEHCYFENVKGVVTLHPHEDSITMVNGIRINKAKKLRPGYRIILGDFHVFRFNNPEEVRLERTKAKQPNISINGPLIPSGNGEDSAKASDSPTSTDSLISEAVIDWNFAKREVAINSLSSGIDTNLNTLGTLPDDDHLKKIQRIRRTRPDSRNSAFDDNSYSPEIPAAELEDKLKVIKEEMQQQLDLQKQEYEEKIKLIEKSNQEYEEKIKLIEKSNQEYEEKIKLIEKSNQEYEEKIKLTEKSNQEYEEKIKLIEKSNQEHEEKIKSEEKSNQEYEEKIKLIEKSNQEYEEKVKLIEKSNQEYEEKVKLIEKSNQEYEEKVKLIEKSNQEHEEKVKSIEKSNQEYEEKVKSIEKSNQEYEEKIKLIEKSNQEYEEKIKLIEKSNQEFEEKVKLIEKSNQEYEEKINLIEKSNQEYEEKIKSIEKSNQEYEEKTKSIEKSNQEYEEKTKSIEKSNQEYEEKIKLMEKSNLEVDKLKAEKTQMEEKLKMVQKEMQLIQAQEYQHKFSYNPQEEEERIKKLIEDEDINYFEYSNFNKIENIDEGGFGIVNKAKTNDKKQVVLKCFIERKNSKIEDDDVKKFVKELKLLRTISSHDNINSFLGITIDLAGNYIMILEYANGGNLRDYLKENFDLLLWENKIQMALDIIYGLKYLHSKGIIHKDLHSKNILVNNDRLLIADFRLTKKLTVATSNSTENRIGIIEYVDPQFYKNINYERGKKSDIYSLGVLLWEITSGQPPFHNFSKDVIERDILRYHISHLNLREKPIEDTPSKYKQLYQNCWNDDPRKRPDINQVYDEILNQSSQFNTDDTNTQHEDSLVVSNSNNKYNLNLQPGHSNLCIEIKLLKEEAN